MTTQFHQESEVARLRAAISAEHLAASRALHDFALSGRHAFITAKQQRIGEHFQTLAAVVGSERQAMEILVETLAQVESEE